MPTHRPGLLRHHGRMFPQPTAPVMRRCRRCGHPVRADRAIQGYGRDCATRLGLVGSAPDIGQDGPDLFTAAGEDDACDGRDRPADTPSPRRVGAPPSSRPHGRLAA